MVLYVFQQVEPELIQPQIHNRNTAGHVLNVNDFLLQSLELRAAVLKVSFFLRVNQVIIAVEVMTVIFMRVSTRDFRLMYSSKSISGQKFTSWIWSFLLPMRSMRPKR